MKDFFVILIGRVFQVLASIFSVKLLTNMLDVAEIGRYYLLSSLLSWVSLVFINPVSTFMGRHFIEWKELNTLKSRYKIYSKYTLFVAFISVLFFAVWNNFFGFGVSVSTLFLVLILFFNIAVGEICALSITGLNIFNKRYLYVFLTNLVSWGGMGLAFLFVVKFSKNAENWIIGFTIAKILGGMIAFLIFFKFFGKSEKDNTSNMSSFIAEIFKFSWPLAIGVGLYWIQTQGYRFVFSNIAGKETLGLFGAGYAVGSGLLTAYEQVFNQYYQPIFYKEITTDNKELRMAAVRRYAERFIPTVIVVSSGIIAFSSVVIVLFTAPKFAGAFVAVIWSVIIETIRIIHTAYYQAAIAEKNSSILLLSGFSGALGAIGFMFLLSRFGLNGAGIALTLSWAIMLCVQMFLMRNKMKNILPLKKILKTLLFSIPILSFFFVLKALFLSKSYILCSSSSIIIVSYGASLVINCSKEWLFTPKVQERNL